MDKFITEAFAQIKENFGVDFTDNINLRITLALHCMSLQIRIKYDMQMKNDMLDYIRDIPMGYDIREHILLSFLSQKYGKKVSDDETGITGSTFYSSLMELNSGVGKIKNPCDLIVEEQYDIIIKTVITQMVLRQSICSRFLQSNGCHRRYAG